MTRELEDVLAQTQLPDIELLLQKADGTYIDWYTEPRTGIVLGEQQQLTLSVYDANVPTSGMHSLSESLTTALAAEFSLAKTRYPSVNAVAVGNLRARDMSDHVQPISFQKYLVTVTYLQLQE